MLHTSITSLAALCLLMLSSVPAQATCYTECSAVPVLDTVSCEPSAIIEGPCAGHENCNPSQLTYGWPADLPLSLHVTCTSTCCAPDGNGEHACQTSEYSLTSSDGVRMLDISFEEPVEACGTQVITASEAVGEAASLTVSIYLNDGDNRVATVIMQLGESVGEGQGCTAAPGYSRGPVQGGWLLLVAGLFTVRRFWSPPSSR